MERVAKDDRWLTAFWLSLWALLAGALLLAANGQADSELRARMHAFEKQTLDLSEVAEQIVGNQIQRIDETLRFLRESFVANRQGFPETIKRLRSGPLADPTLRVVLVDPGGHLIYTDAPNVPARFYVGDQPYFRFFAEGGSDRLYIDEPRFGRVTRQYTLPLVRPVFDKEGGFLGVVAISVRQESLSHFGQALAQSKDTTISIAKSGGAIVARSHNLAGVQGTRLSPALLAAMHKGRNGVFSDHAPNDDIARTIAYQHLGALPLIIFAEAYPRDIMRDAAQRRALLQSIAVLMALLALALVLVLLQRRKTLTQVIATQQLHIQEAQRIAGMGSWELDLASRTFKWSAEVYRLFGVSPERFSPSLENFLLMVDEADRAAVHAEIERAVVDGEGAIDFVCRRGDGQLRRMSGRGEVVCNQASKVIALIGTVRDVTDQRAAEQALAQSEAHFRSLASAVPVGIFDTDGTGACIYVNARFCEITGGTAESSLGSGWINHIHADDRGRVSEAWQGALNDAAAPFSAEHRFVRPDGSIAWVFSQAMPETDANGALTGYVGSVTDISTHRQSELTANRLLQRNQVLMQNALDGIHVMDEAGRVLEANDAFCKLLGYTQTEIRQLRVADWEAKMTPDALKSAFTELLNGGKSLFETLNRHKDGRLIEVEISAVGIELAGEKFIYAASRDISERKQSQQQLEDLIQQRTADLNEALQEARVADQTKDAFLANITHELRTPLSAMIGFSGLARPFSTDARQRDYLDKIVSAGKTLSGLINDLLDLSKIAAGHMTLEVSSFSLHQLLSRSLSVISHKAEERGLTLCMQVDESIPDVLYGDTLRIEQILLNLLSNAVKFTPSGRVEVRIGLLERIGARVCLRIEVEDSGIGLSEEEISLLFKPFTQADASMSRKFGGTGLGLAICKRLAEIMGGEISVRSRKGSGATFCVTLWLALGDISELAAAEQPIDSGSLPASYQEARVLVVDDQLFNREVVEGLLAVVGIAPCMASNGQDALDLLTAAGADRFDLVLMDIQMPVMDGLNATRALRKLEGFEQLPIIAMTAHTMAHEKAIGSAAGMNDHIGKPFDDQAFYRTLAKWLPRSKHSDITRAATPRSLPSAGALPPMRDIDTAAGLTLFVGNEARYRHWLADFVAEAPGHVAQIRQALTDGQPQQGAAAAHILKGRSGMLGMHAFQTIATALEAALNEAGPAGELQEQCIQLEQASRLLCEEISRKLGLSKNAAAPTPPAAASVPAGPMPAAIVELLALLEAGDGDCDEAISRCLETFGEKGVEAGAKTGNDSAWAENLRLALDHVKNFDYRAARESLCITPQNPPQGK
jgi:PAS domain S-box-containing protein